MTSQLRPGPPSANQSTPPPPSAPGVPVEGVDSQGGKVLIHTIADVLIPPGLEPPAALVASLNATAAAADTAAAPASSAVAAAAKALVLGLPLLVAGLL
jgi:hypothetical protein